MIRLATLSVVLLLAGCATPERAGEADPLTRSTRPASAEVRSSRPLDETVLLYNRAWEEYRTVNWSGARRLVEEAIASLGPDTAENATPQRVRLIGKLAQFQYFELGMEREGVWTWKRAERLHRKLPVPDARLAVLGSLSSRPSGAPEGPLDPELFAIEEEQTAEAEGDSPTSTEENALHEGAEEQETVASHSASPGSENREAKESDRTAAPSHSPERGSPGSAIASDRRLLAVLTLLRLGRRDKADELIDDGLRRYSELGEEDSDEARRLRELKADPDGRSERPPVEEQRTYRELPDEREKPALRRMVKELSEDPSTDPAVLGDLAGFAGDRDTARRSYESLSEDDSAGPRRRLAGTMGRARHAGSGSSALALLEQASEDARREFPPNHQAVLETRERYARGVKDARGAASYCDLVETYLADQRATLGDAHPIVQATRRELAAEYARQGDTRRAIRLQRQALGSLEQSVPSDHPIVSQARLELARILDQAGEHDGALQVLRSATPGTARGALRDLRAEAIRLQRARQLVEALEVRRQIVARAAEEEDPGAQAEDLRDLAAVLRVLGQATEARGVEAEARLLERADAPEPEKLARLVAEASVHVARAPAPTVVLQRSAVDASGRCRITVDVEDAAGIVALSLVQDGIPRTLPLVEADWTFDESGTRAQVEIPISLAPDQDLSVVSIAAENTAHAVSASESVLVERP